MKEMKLKSRKNKVTHKNIILLSVLVLCLFIGIGFAYLQSSLSINGNSVIARGTWDVHYENLVVKEGSTGADNPATISEDKKSIDLTLNFTELSQYYEFEVDIVNAGELDAMLDYSDMMNYSNELNNMINYSVKYLNSVDFKPNAILPAQARERVRITFEMKDKSDWYFGENNFNLESFYVQATDEAREWYRFINESDLKDGFLYGSSATYDESNDKYILNDTVSFSEIDEIMAPLYEKQDFLNSLFNKILKYYDIENTDDKGILNSEITTMIDNINQFDSQVNSIKEKIPENSNCWAIDEYNGMLERIKTLITRFAIAPYGTLNLEEINKEILHLNEEGKRMKEMYFTSWAFAYEKVDTYKYTCLNESGECKMLYSLYDSEVEGVYYKPFINGDIK